MSAFVALGFKKLWSSPGTSELGRLCFQFGKFGAKPCMLGQGVPKRDRQDENCATGPCSVALAGVVHVTVTALVTGPPGATTTTTTTTVTPALAGGAGARRQRLSPSPTTTTAAATTTTTTTTTRYTGSRASCGLNVQVRTLLLMTVACTILGGSGDLITGYFRDL